MLEAGWLRRSIRSAELQLRATHFPLQLFGQGVLATLPLEGEEADDLFYRLSRLFEAWTGKDIQHYAATKE